MAAFSVVTHKGRRGGRTSLCVLLRDEDAQPQGCSGG